MAHIKTLAPTLFDTLKAVELGCRKIQDDRCFYPEMSTWITIVTKDYCVGCLATCTLMQLSNKTGKDIINCFSPTAQENPIQVADRAFAYEIEQQRYCEEEEYTDFSYFEAAIDSLRHSEILPLLKFYGLDQHTNARTAVGWFTHSQIYTLNYGTGKQDLLLYADFIKDKVIPKMEALFG